MIRCRPFVARSRQLVGTTLIAGCLVLALPDRIGLLAGECGCEPPPCATSSCAPTVCHVHRHCHWGRLWHHGPPMGMVVPSAPMMAAPVMAAPMMAAPMAAAPAYAAPSYSYAPLQAPQTNWQLALVQAPGNNAPAAPTDQSDRMMRALAQALGGSCQASNGANSALQAPAKSLEDRVDSLEQRVTELERMTTEIVDVLKEHSAQLKSRNGK